APCLPAASLRGDLLQGEGAGRLCRPVRGGGSTLGLVERGGNLLIAERELVEGVRRGRCDGGLCLRLGLHAGGREDRDDAHDHQTTDEAFSSHTTLLHRTAAAMPGATRAKTLGFVELSRGHWHGGTARPCQPSDSNRASQVADGGGAPA